ncbi:MAG: hypothetical protein K2H43_02965, partial [Clostridia bacterium]|nr:hypothetical protein [Clostridia bacterium]
MKTFGMKNKITVSAVMFLLALLLSLTAFFGIRHGRNNNADALANVNSAYLIGERGDGTQLTDIFDSATGKFKAEYVDELLSKISGTTNATLTNLQSMISSASTVFGSNLVTAPTINANAGKPNDGIVVKIGGYDWMVTSLVNSGNDVVVTLMLSDVVGTGIRFSASYDSSNWVTSNAPATMYGSSLARQELINPSGLFGNFVSGSMTSYLVKPVDVAYQHTMDVRYLNNFGSMSLQNEGLDNVGEYLPNFNFYGKTGNGNGTGYSDWGNDYIWLPAFSEAAQTNNAGFIGGIWKLTRNQYLHSGAVYYSIFRSCMYSGTAINVCGVAADGTLDAWQPNLVGAPHDVGLRPAIHLNLTKVVQDAVYTAPTYESGLDPAYNGAAQTLYTVLQTTATNPMTYNPSWYRKGIYNPAGNNSPMTGLTVKFYKGLSADNKGYLGGTVCEVTSMTDAGDYEVVLTLSRGKKCSGTPDTGRGENDQIRLYKFKIKQ